MAILQSSLPSSFPCVPRHLTSPQPRPPLASSFPLVSTSTSPLPALRRLNRKPPTSAIKDESSSSLSSLVADLQLHQKAEQADYRQPQDGLAARWREIHGSSNWDGMLDPMDPLLRSEIIRYGEFVQACYDSFDFDKFSPSCGGCKYDRPLFFSSLGMDGAGYDVTRYLYATSNVKVPKFFIKSVLGSRIWSERANWIGYVAVSNDETTARLGRRDILVVWRGTVTKIEWIHDFMANQQPVRAAGIPTPDPAVKAETGFTDLYVEKDPSCRFCKYSVREQVLTEVKKLVERYGKAGEEVSVTVTGHSLGSALATLSAYDIAEMGLLEYQAEAAEQEEGKGEKKKAAAAVFSFAGPRVGNGHFKRRMEELGVKVLRMVNVHDGVPDTPGVLINEHMPEFIQRTLDGYTHVGVELELDSKHSPFLKDIVIDPSNYHNLEAYLHLVDGYHGKGKKFESATGRDPALVNKSSDFLKDHLVVPPVWMQDRNKGMVRTPDGRWTLDRPKLEDHPEDIHHHYQQLGLDRV